MKNHEYWKKRAQELSKRQREEEAVLQKRIQKDYAMLLHTLDEELSKFYVRYAANESISLDKARKLLSRAELENFRISLEEFIEKARADGYDKELNEIYLRSQISRLQALQTQIEMRTHELYQSQRDLLHTSAMSF